ncbi:hypothetical protein C7121_16395 [Paenibacillus glucanolyticus]|uniref:hypothetical protein n=1 Tax=Paenibacillus TaxID=44249 RepID=UPI0003E1F34C|nr:MULTISPECIES: hypothetical protein [Paenibacillus]ANA78500.1 hypothetical protein A3958_00160 [Paenibacillus glucanolyticus]AVV57584.1 hypothetical protein C7121_16395 [Paenibacillus glucanolyticus]ETT34351.1 hypothetical protein C169_18374 [Paenibacillus sp. FSL R5-808]
MKHTLENEISRTFAETMIPSLLELNQSFHQYMDSLNDLQFLMLKRGLASSDSATGVQFVSQFLYIYHQKINISLSWLNKKDRVTWIPITIHMVRLTEQLRDKMGHQVLQSRLSSRSPVFYAEEVKRTTSPSPPLLAKTMYSPDKSKDEAIKMKGVRR